MATETVTVTRKSTEMSHGRTYYYEAGIGHPVILLHGSGIDQGGVDYARSMELLGREMRVLAPDLLGWPPSDTFGDIASFAYLVDFLREFQDSLGIQKSHIVGVSMGGWIAGIFAYESPERVDKVIMGGNPGLYGSPNRRMAQWQPPSDETVTKWIDDVTESTGLDSKSLLAEKLEKLREPGLADAFSRLMRHMADDANRKRYALDRRLPHLKVPAMILWGERDNNVEHAAISAGLAPDARAKVIAAGHRMHIEDPVLFSNTVLEFLR